MDGKELAVWVTDAMPQFVTEVTPENLESFMRVT